MGAILSFIPTLLGLLGDLPKVVAAIEFILNAITEVEATGQTGTQKLDAVLNSFEAYLTANFPNLAAPFETIAADVEGFVNATVGLLNTFAKAAPAKAP